MAGRLEFYWYETKPGEEAGTAWGQLAGASHRLHFVCQETFLRISVAKPDATLLIYDSTLTCDAMPYSVLLVDCHRILRDGIKAILEGTADFHVVGETGNGANAVSSCVKLHPD